MQVKTIITKHLVNSPFVMAGYMGSGWGSMTYMHHCPGTISYSTLQFRPMIPDIMDITQLFTQQVVIHLHNK